MVEFNAIMINVLYTRTNFTQFNLNIIAFITRQLFQKNEEKRKRKEEKRKKKTNKENR